MPNFRTHKQFLSEIADRPFVALDRYVFATTKMQFRCSVEGCGYRWSAVPYSVLRGCGCPRCGDRLTGNANRKSNSILHDYGDGTILIDVSTPKHPKATCRLDKDVFEAIEGRIQLHGKGYPLFFSKGKRIQLHQFVLPDIQPSMVRDHISRDKTDCRRANLRIVTESENRINVDPPRNNKSGVTGVFWFKHINKWQAYICKDGVRFNLGYFKDKKDAIAARRKAEEYYFGEFAPLASSSI